MSIILLNRQVAKTKRIDRAAAKFSNRTDRRPTRTDLIHSSGLPQRPLTGGTSGRQNWNICVRVGAIAAQTSVANIKRYELTWRVGHAGCRFTHRDIVSVFKIYGGGAGGTRICLTPWSAAGGLVSGDRIATRGAGCAAEGETRMVVLQHIAAPDGVAAGRGYRIRLVATAQTSQERCRGLTTIWSRTCLPSLAGRR
jgi:hypothetical protein